MRVEPLLLLMAMADSFLPHVVRVRSPVLQNQPDDEEEWHPRDHAASTSQLLVGIWSQIADAATMSKGVSSTCDCFDEV